MSELPAVDPPKTAKVRFRIQTIDINDLVSEEVASKRRRDYLKRCLVRMFPPRHLNRMAPYGVQSIATIDDNIDPLVDILHRADIPVVVPEDELAKRLEQVDINSEKDEDDLLYDLGETK